MYQAPVAGAVPPPGVYAEPPLAYGPPVGGPPLAPFDGASTVTSVREDEDFTYWRYSKAKLPFLLVILAIFTVLICLTMWQSRSDIRWLKSGVPRDLEPHTTVAAKEGGIPKYKRNLRFTVCFLGLLFPFLAFLVFIAPLKPVLRAKINYLIAIFLIITSILALVAFGLDVNSERDARKCTSNPHYTPVCESFESIATAITTCDALVAVFALTAGLCLFFYSRSGDWSRARDPKLVMPDGPGQLQPGMYPNGVSYVRKWVTSLALFAVVACAILLLIFTLIVHEARDRSELLDLYNRPIASAQTTRPGWPVKNTKLRYAACGFVILTALLNLIPLTSRVVAYVFGFLYVLYAIVTFVAFGVDVDSIQDARNITCPSDIRCVYHPYNAVATLDFMGGLALIIYVVVEYFVNHRKKAQPPPAM
eukprot:NODE_506_length_1416_cov_274.269201_g472_i0.p1 GENE.NODE_506_length_1416_cov_274.269201_g472_i0~~NODE_506_length_1416_cov_274.269201_g472_i0.p1  ORF type:complete len:421 (+),score=100.67 NODE_506_length_1416_cov_274.269201_g472_i0:62-1324(+)